MDMDYETAGDGALVAAIGRFKDAALAEVFRRHSGAVHGLARRVLGSANLAEEVTQDVFLGLWKQPEQFDVGRAPLRTLLLTKAHSRAVDLVRAEAARHNREQRTASDRAAAGYDLERFVWDLAVADQVKTAVETLPEGELPQARFDVLPLTAFFPHKQRGHDATDGHVSSSGAA